MFPSKKLFLFLFNKQCISRAKYSIEIGGKPLGGLFFHPKVQFFMKKLITVNYERIFRPLGLGETFPVPVYKFMTDDELQEAKKNSHSLAVKLLQIPPIIDVSDDEIEVLSKDSSLDGFEEHHSKVIFIDTSFDLEPHERNIVVREPDGVLRTANKDEKFRIIETFFPKQGREIIAPKMFEPEHLKEVLDRGDYEFILNRACLQFEPDQEIFHNILMETFERINEENAFEKLMETRHFGSLGFYLAIKRNINKMLGFFIEREKLMEASHLVNLYYTVHSNSQNDQDLSAEEVEDAKEISFDDACKVVKDYLSNPSHKASKLESFFDALVEKLKYQQKFETDILKSHVHQLTT